MEQQPTDQKHTLSYIKSELNRIQTIAGTLSTVESKHHTDLMNMGDNKLNQMATEEQSASRQLGEVKALCLSLSQKIDEMQKGNQELGD